MIRVKNYAMISSALTATTAGTRTLTVVVTSSSYLKVVEECRVQAQPLHLKQDEQLKALDHDHQCFRSGLDPYLIWISGSGISIGNPDRIRLQAGQYDPPKKERIRTFMEPESKIKKLWRIFFAVHFCKPWPGSGSRLNPNSAKCQATDPESANLDPKH